MDAFSDTHFPRLSDSRLPGVPGGTRCLRLLILLLAAGCVAGAVPAFGQEDTSPQGNPPPTSNSTASSEQSAPAIQPELPGERFNGRPIARIELVKPQRSGTKTILVPIDSPLADFARNQIRSIAGARYNQKTVSSDVARLSRTGRFAQIDAAVKPLDDGAVVLVFSLVEQPIIEAVQAVGNTQLTDEDINAVVGLLEGTPVDTFQLDRAARRIEDLYREKGYYNAQVKWDEQELKDNNIVLFRITEGNKLRVTDIRFEGVKSVPLSEVRRKIKTKEAFLFLKAPLDDDKLDADVAAIYNFYRDHGYLDVRVDRNIQPAPNNREAILTFYIDEGPLYHRGDVLIETTDPSPRFSPEQLAALMPMKQGEVYSINKLRKSIDTIRAAYHKEGYADVQINTQELRRDDGHTVDVLMNISQGSFYRTGEVLPKGNTYTRSSEIMRHVHNADVKPGRPLDPTKIKDAEKTIAATRLFDTRYEPPRITPQVVRQTPARDTPKHPEKPEDSAAGVQIDLLDNPFDPVYRDVLVEVKETDTGEFNFGAALSSDSGVVGQISIVQRNFDIRDTPDTLSDFLSGKAFRGGAQTLRLELLPGSRVQTYSLSLSDPSLYDTDYTGSGSVFFRNRVFSNYDEQRYGTRLGLGRRFGTQWVGNALVRVESVQLQNIDSDQPVDVFDVADQNILTSIGLSLTRVTLDDRFRPTRGSRSKLGIEQVGILGGDFTFTKFNAEHEIFVPILEDFLGRTTVLSSKVELNYIPQSPKDVPVYERYYLGGQSFRGFDFRSVSPIGIRNDTGKPGNDEVGGTYSFFWGIQLNRPLIGEMVNGVIFLDTGTVTNDFGFDNYRASAGFGLRLYVPQVSPAPIGFDFGFPILEESTDQHRIFTFFIDVPF